MHGIIAKQSGRLYIGYACSAHALKNHGAYHFPVRHLFGAIFM